MKQTTWEFELKDKKEANQLFWLLSEIDKENMITKKEVKDNRVVVVIKE